MAVVAPFPRGCRLQLHLIHRLQMPGLLQAIRLEVLIDRNALAVARRPLAQGLAPSIGTTLPTLPLAASDDIAASLLHHLHVLGLRLPLELFDLIDLQLAVLEPLRSEAVHVLPVLPLASEPEHDLKEVVHLVPLLVDLRDGVSLVGGGNDHRGNATVPQCCGRGEVMRECREQRDRAEGSQHWRHYRNGPLPWGGALIA
mmetsp:Transcript_110439/g.235919  ORF Transcript_110439/g.235919 Transcript_110439/m.235919 type:complete len:200 (+) Transcript_110439:801-1400(+)